MTETAIQDYGDFKNFKKGEVKPMPIYEWIYLQYILVSGLYMLEPWERKLFNSIIVTVISIFAVLIKYLFF
ncbi:unnamed protein product [Caenorhabditis angaria]|uniref:Uncharacterized protein n=1 Tax=Caenorhabditis angaria TaxID=860376 RepID=A0A9P1N632_9PELO|nr:unnamed protein product [Caenorhabditis angaria]